MCGRFASAYRSLHLTDQYISRVLRQKLNNFKRNRKSAGVELHLKRSLQNVRDHLHACHCDYYSITFSMVKCTSQVYEISLFLCLVAYSIYSLRVVWWGEARPGVLAFRARKKTAGNCWFVLCILELITAHSRVHSFLRLNLGCLLANLLKCFRVLSSHYLVKIVQKIEKCARWCCNGKKRCPKGGNFAVKHLDNVTIIYLLK